MADISVIFVSENTRQNVIFPTNSGKPYVLDEIFSTKSGVPSALHISSDVGYRRLCIFSCSLMFCNVQFASGLQLCCIGTIIFFNFFFILFLKFNSQICVMVLVGDTDIVLL